MELQDRVALVTGAGSGVGAATALALARAGAAVILVGPAANEIEALAARAGAQGRHTMAAAVDVADERQMSRLFRRIGKRFGRLDFVFANTAINDVWAPIDQLKPAAWDETIRRSFRGTYLTVHEAVPLMKKAGGAIAITNSINGRRALTTAGASAHSTTTVGQLALGQMLALRLARYKIGVNVICHGAARTAIRDSTRRRAVAKAKVPRAQHEAGTARRVAELAVCLASGRSKNISGTPIWIDEIKSLT